MKRTYLEFEKPVETLEAKIESLKKAHDDHPTIDVNKELNSLQYLGCTLEEFKAHIESQWQEGMSWENHSLDGWHIDHIKPIDWYVKHSDDPWQANHYTNLQPLWAEENLSKNNKIIIYFIYYTIYYNLSR